MVMSVPLILNILLCQCQLELWFNELYIYKEPFETAQRTFHYNMKRKMDCIESKTHSPELIDLEHIYFDYIQDHFDLYLLIPSSDVSDKGISSQFICEH